jgi:hypothetical protein
VSAWISSKLSKCKHFDDDSRILTDLYSFDFQLASFSLTTTRKKKIHRDCHGLTKSNAEDAGKGAEEKASTGW